MFPEIPRWECWTLLGIDAVSSIRVPPGVLRRKTAESEYMIAQNRALFRLCYLDRVGDIYWAEAADRCAALALFHR